MHLPSHSPHPGNLYFPIVFKVFNFLETDSGPEPLRSPHWACRPYWSPPRTSVHLHPFSAQPYGPSSPSGSFTCWSPPQCQQPYPPSPTSPVAWSALLPVTLSSLIPPLLSSQSTSLPMALFSVPVQSPPVSCTQPLSPVPYAFERRRRVICFCFLT